MGGTLSRLVLLASFFVGLVTVPGSSAQKLPAPAASPRDNLKSQIKLSLPMSFESNQGQVAKEADFVARGAGYTALLQAGRARICLSHRLEGSSESTCRRDQELVIELVGARKRPDIQPEDKLPGYSNYLFGSDPSKWITNVAQYARVRYGNVYPGIDIVYHGNQGRMEHDFVVRHGADTKRIGLAFTGVDHMEISGGGDLKLHMAKNEVQLQRPRAYQVIGNKEVEVAAEYVLRQHRVGFRLGQHDESQKLIIDPVLAYATFLGGDPLGTQQGVSALTLDASDNLYIAGSTNASNFPVTPGVVGPNLSGTSFVSKINPAGTSLQYSTYISGITGLLGLAVDVSGNVYLAGFGADQTGSGAPGLPIPPGSNPFQATNKGRNLAILKLNSTATAVLYATYLGGSGTENFAGLAIDAAGNAYISGSTNSNDFPTQNPLQGSLGTSGKNGFVTKLNSTGSALSYSTYVGQNSDVEVVGIALDASNNAYLVGNASAGFPTTSGAFQATGLGAFLAKLDPTGSTLLDATYIAGSANSGNAGDRSTAVAVDHSGNVFVTGLNFSSDFPVVNPIHSCNNPNAVTMFLSEFNAAGTLMFSTCFGDHSIVNAMTLDTAGRVYVSGFIDASLPLKNPIDSNPPSAGPPLQLRSFVSEIDPITRILLFSSFIAGPVMAGGASSTSDAINAIAVDSTGNIYATGISQVFQSGGSDLFPIFNALQQLFGNTNNCSQGTPNCTYSDAIIMKIAPTAGGAAAVAPSGLQFPATQVDTTTAPQSLKIYDLGTDPLTVSNVTVSGDFAIPSNTCATVAASAGSCTIQVTFKPTTVGTSNGTLTITDSSAGSPHTVALTGQGSLPAASLTPTSLSFTNQAVGTTSLSQPVTLTNTAAISLQIAHIQTTSDFSETNGCGATLSAFGSCIIQVTFTPTTTGQRSGSLTITDNAADSPQSISLIGNVPAGFVISTGSSPSSATIAAGATATFNLNLNASGGFSGPVQFSCSGVPAASHCTASPNPVTLDVISPAVVAVSIATTARTVAQMLSKERQPNYGRGSLSPLLAVFTVFGIFLVPICGRWRQRRISSVSLGLILTALLGFGCGGGGGTPPGNQTMGTPTGTYDITVSGRSGSVTQSLTLKLTIQ